jgi:hypothetical protein
MLSLILPLVLIFASDETKAVDRVMELTQKQLMMEQELKELIIVFEKQQDEFFNGNQTKEHASNMVMTADKILDLIEENQLSSLFSTIFLEELKRFSMIARKSTPARP